MSGNQVICITVHKNNSHVKSECDGGKLGEMRAAGFTEGQVDGTGVEVE